MKYLNIALAALATLSGYQIAEASRVTEYYDHLTPGQAHPTAAEAATYPEWSIASRVIQFAVYQCSGFSSSSRINHEKTVKKVIRYLERTKECRQDTQGLMLCYC